MSEEMDYTTAPCDWTDKDDDIIADYLTLKDMGAKNVSELNC